MVVHAYYEKDARVRRYAESLAALGHDVEVIALRDPGTEKVELLDGVTVRRVPLARKRGGLPRYLWEYLCFFVLATLWLCRGCMRGRYDLVHVHNMPDFLVFTALVPKLLGAFVVLDVHDLMPEVYASKFGVDLAHPGIIPLRVQEVAAHLFADRVIFATEFFRSLAIERGTVAPESSFSVVNAAELRIFDAERYPWVGPGTGEFHLLYLGTVSDRHGVDQIVRALPLLRDQIPGLLFVLYPRFAEGEGKPLEALEALARELGVRDLLEIRSPVPLGQVPVVMSRSSVGLFTPHLDVHIDIALSLKVPEYVAMGLPIVTTRTTIMTSLFDENEVLMFEDDDTQELASCILRLHREPELGRELALRATRFQAEHSWPAEFERYVTELEALIGEGRLRPAHEDASVPLVAHERTPRRSSDRRETADA